MNLDAVTAFFANPFFLDPLHAILSSHLKFSFIAFLLKILLLVFV